MIVKFDHCIDTRKEKRVIMEREYWDTTLIVVFTHLFYFGTYKICLIIHDSWSRKTMIF